MPTIEIPIRLSESPTELEDLSETLIRDLQAAIDHGVLTTAEARDLIEPIAEIVGYGGQPWRTQYSGAGYRGRTGIEKLDEILRRMGIPMTTQSIMTVSISHVVDLWNEAQLQQRKTQVAELDQLTKVLMEIPSQKARMLALKIRERVEWITGRKDLVEEILEAKKDPEGNV